jgi:hypothetical protein
MLRNRALSCAVLLLAFSGLAFAKDSIAPVDWPADNPIVHFEIGKMVKTTSFNNQNVFSVDLAVKNVSSKKITNASFRVYFEDKQKIRIGDGWVSVTNVKPGETVKMVMTAQTIGNPTEFTVAPERLPEDFAYLAPPRLVPTTVYSVPSGAKLSIDGKDVGVTPIAVKLAVGSHSLHFEKDGFTPGSFPMNVAQDQLAGGSVTFELGGAQRDTVELRDGTVLTGDLQYINATEVVLQIGGNLQKYSRNLVKRVLLVEREIPAQVN